MKGRSDHFFGSCYHLNGLGEFLHILHRLGVAQLDRPLVVLSCAAKARGHAGSVAVHHTERVDGVRMILSRGLLEPCPPLLVVHIHTEALDVDAADLVLAHIVTPLGTDLVRHHRSPVVDRHALAPVVDIANKPCRFDVALLYEASDITKLVRRRRGKMGR